MTSNSAAWLVGEKVKPLEVKTAPYTSPGDNEILVKNAAVAVNPVDWVLQTAGIFPLQYPTILGSDVAGEVVEVGKSVSRFKKGDRVLGLANWYGSKKDTEAGYQLYTILRPVFTSPIPDDLSFDRASVLPLCVATAAAGLYQDHSLQLQYPSLDPQPTNKSLLIWGGASSVGSNAIQLAVASGYEVLTTASAQNFDYVKRLGASQVFDYNKGNVIDEIVATLNAKPVVGIFDAVSANGAVEACLELSSKAKNSLFVSTVRPLPENLPSGVQATMVGAVTIENDNVGKAVFVDFLPQALADGKYVAAPDPHVVGKGLEHVQTGFDTLQGGVSAKKVVIAL
ncbi:MAG: hypothetical protein L6R41_003290 [Letrouitia leprolyta]|nr:MAG: hypothetical protein L6R41_003290 [Letrouitia leprolyta]